MISFDSQNNTDLYKGIIRDIFTITLLNRKFGPLDLAFRPRPTITFGNTFGTRGFKFISNIQL